MADGRGGEGRLGLGALRRRQDRCERHDGVEHAQPLPLHEQGQDVDAPRHHAGGRPLRVRLAVGLARRRKLGIGTYYRLSNDDDGWYVYGSVFGPGSKPSFTLLDPVSVENKMCESAPGDLMSSEFNPDGTLDVV